MSAAPETVEEGRSRRIETRLTRLMLALGVDPGHQYDINQQGVQVNLRDREVLVQNLDFSLLDCANAIAEDGGDLRLAWSIVLRERVIGQITFAE